MDLRIVKNYIYIYIYIYMCVCSNVVNGEKNLKILTKVEKVRQKSQKYD